jgi:hypothetical protein
MAYTPSPMKSESGKTTFNSLVVDSNRVVMTGSLGNYFVTQDATASPVASPVTVNTSQTLTVPQNATRITVISVSNPVQVSEDSTQSEYFVIPAGTQMTFDCARQQFIYLKTASSTVVSFYFAEV